MIFSVVALQPELCRPVCCCPAPAGKKSRQLLEESESEGEHEAPPAKRGKVGQTPCIIGFWGVSLSFLLSVSM